MNNQADSKGKSSQWRMFFQRLFSIGLMVALAAGVIGSYARPSIAEAADEPRQQGAVQSASAAGTNAMIAWNEIAVQCMLAEQQNPAQQFMYMAPVQAAIYNAVIAIEGGYELYNSALEVETDASVEAAVAAAAHGMLVYLFPNQTGALDGHYTSALAAIPDGEMKNAGLAVGQAAAEEMIAMRQGDGREADIGFTMPAPGVGVWQLPAGANPVSPWISQHRPYLLESPDQFRPGPPPKLRSSKWAKDYKETLLWGSLNSQYRTPEQADIARFWAAPASVQYNRVFQQIAQDYDLVPAEAARLMAMGTMIPADALIACFDAKYHYLFWRPAYAIPQGDNDGNKKTAGDPAWAPFLGTPGHPEYPSAHSCLTAATVDVLVAFLGTERINIDIASSVPNLVQPVRHYEYATDLVQELVDARIWGGIHYRTSNNRGVTLGHKVAKWGLKHYFQPEP